MALIDDIAGLVSAGLVGAGMTKDATLIVVTAGSRTPGAYASGNNPTTANVACKGLVTRWRRELLGASTVQVGDRVVLLFGATLGTAVPKAGDQITIESVTGRVIDVERDPAAATYACLTRK